MAEQLIGKGKMTLEEIADCVPILSFASIYLKSIVEDLSMSKYCPECKMNFSDSFDKCVYCGSSLLDGIIESNEDDTQLRETNIFNMTDEEILKKYQSYKRNIEEQTGEILSDKEFINGLKLAKRESLFKQSIINNSNNLNDNNIITITCPYCHSTDTKKISGFSKAVVAAIGGIFALDTMGKQWHCNRCDSDF